MKKKTRLFNVLFILILFLSACNLPTDDQGQGLSSTAAAQTVEALLSATPANATPIFTATASGPATLTPIPSPVFTNTPAATATPNCPLAQFVTDVTIPDGTVMNPGQTFNKKWRLKNIGACAWNGYSLVFDSGESMNGPATKAIGTVNPGQEIDIDVDLKAPNTAGTYRGYWRLVTNSNVLVPVVSGYQGRAFYVEIKVAAPTNTLPPAIAQVILNNLTNEDGFVTSSGSTNPNPNVGDNNSNEAVQAFVSFDMSAIPAGATIVKVEVDFSGYDTLGNPWSLSDGCLRAYAQNYGTLDAGDYVPNGDPSGAYLRWCGAGELSSVFENADMKTLVQSAVGSSRLQLRLQFKSPNPTINGTADMVRFGNIKLIVTYQ
ncbi:MAG TPA: hypothetical protein DEP19_02430 [Anaerolineae bacterium]|nr:hypothetical protein [Anaerolineae bacterium]HCK66671.1 hypothetical protein [Anaerolineae bacterium]